MYVYVCISSLIYAFHDLSEWLPPTEDYKTKCKVEFFPSTIQVSEVKLKLWGSAALSHLADLLPPFLLGLLILLYLIMGEFIDGKRKVIQI